MTQICIRNLRILAALLYSCAVAPIIASDQPPPDSAAKQTDHSHLYDHKTWLKLLHAVPVDGGGYRGDVVSNDFYLSRQSPLNPAKELDATVFAFSKTDERAVELRCRYQARFMWLNRQLPGQFEHLQNAECPRFTKWSDLQNIDSLSVLQVSGYLGNPASAFGHLLLRVNKKTSKGVRGLQDIGVNFGASIPPGESTFKYIAKGMFGGYSAGFSGNDFYAQDHVYASTEFRDMWAYELNLDQYQLEFLISHLWELHDARFQYFFLRKNCAYHLAELLELVLDESFNLPIQPWYLPVSLFHQLTSLDDALNGTLIRKVSFLPSLQRNAYTEFEQLSAQESAIANRIILDQSFEGVSEQASAAVLNFLLTYIDYKLVGSSDEVKARLKSLRKTVLLKRFSLPGASAQEVIVVPAIAAPASGPKSRKLRVSGVSRSNGEIGAEIQVAMFAYDVLNNNTASLKDSQFKLGELTAQITEDHVTLHQFDIIRIEKLAPRSSHILGENVPAWRMGVGVVGRPPDCVSCSELFVDGGIGQSIQTMDHFLSYGFLDARVMRTESRIGLSLGSYYRVNSALRLHAHGSWFAQTSGKSNSEYGVEGLFNMTKNQDIQLSVSHVNNVTQSSLGVILRW